MGATFFGLEIARSALQSQQRALDVTGHNIANANTKGYTRQEALLSASNPFSVPALNRPTTPGQIGTGVQVDQIRRLRDQFIDTQVRTENKSLGYWEARRDALQKVEVILTEPSDSSLRSVMDQFWESWQELSKNPESLAARSVVQQRGIAVAETFNHIDRSYRQLQSDLNDNIKVKVQNINSIAKQIADINLQILPIEAQGDNANDLRDKRDNLLDELSKIVDIRTYENSMGQVNVTIGGRDIVTGKAVSPLLAVQNSANNGYVDIVWSDDRSSAKFTSGELQGLLESRGYTDPNTGEFVGVIPELRKDLDLMAKTLVDEINKIHKGGYDLNGNQGNNFFRPFEEGVYPTSGISFAEAMQVDAGVLNSLNVIAAGDTATKGDGANALEMAQVKHKSFMDLTKGQSNLLSKWQTRQSYATQADGKTKVDYNLATNIFGAGGLFQTSDLGPNAYFEIKQGAQTLKIDLTDAGGLANLPAGVSTVNELLDYINTEAVAAGMNLTATLETVSGKNYLQIKANDTGEDQSIIVSEFNFVGAATFGWGNANTTGTIDDFYRSQLGKLGVDSQEASRMVDNQELLVDQLDNKRLSLSGVSLDEEMTNMVRFQHAYNAAARVVTVMDEMLDKIINGMGASR